MVGISGWESEHVTCDQTSQTVRQQLRGPIDSAMPADVHRRCGLATWQDDNTGRVRVEFLPLTNRCAPPLRSLVRDAADAAGPPGSHPHPVQHTGDQYSCGYRDDGLSSGHVDREGETHCASTSQIDG